MMKKIAQLVVFTTLTIWAALTVVFCLVALSPVGPFEEDPKVSQEVIAVIRAHFDLDKPFLVRYGKFWWKLVHGDFGQSYYEQGKEVTDIIREALPITLKLGIPAVTIAFTLAILTGVLAAARHNKGTDRVVMGIAMFGISVPEIVIAPALIFIFAVLLNWLPAQGWGTWQHVPLPLITLTLYYYAVLARLVRGGMLEVLSLDYVRTAQAKGCSPIRTLLVHALQGGIRPGVTYLGVATASVLTTGAIVVEKIFNIPGVARHFLDAAMKQDITLLLATTFFATVAVVGANKCVDAMYVLLDPRLRRSA